MICFWIFYDAKNSNFPIFFYYNISLEIGKADILIIWIKFYGAWIYTFVTKFSIYNLGNERI